MQVLCPFYVHIALEAVCIMGLWKSLRVSWVAHGAALAVVHSACLNNYHEFAGHLCGSRSRP
jgi:hypothetical protein